jgi:hypothetical protein
VFRRSIGGGWLMVSGPSPSIGGGGIERLLEVVDLSRPLLFLRPGDETDLGIDSWLWDLEALLEIPLNQVNLDEVDDPALIRLWREAGMVITAGEQEGSWQNLLSTRLSLLQSELTLNPDQVLWFAGCAGTSLGEWVYSHTLALISAGVGWLPGAIILQEEDALGEIGPVQAILRNQPRSYALNLLGGATIAIGPEGEIELWGAPNPAIVLGLGWGDM